MNESHINLTEYAVSGKIDLIIEALANGYKINDQDIGVLEMAARNGYYDIIQLAVNNGGCRFLNSEMLQSAIIFNHLNIVKFLINQGVIIKNKSNTSHHILFAPITMQYYEMIKYLLENGAAAQSDYPLLLCHAAKLNNIKMIKFLIKNGVKVLKSKHLIPAAIKSKNIEIVKLFIKHGAPYTKPIIVFTDDDLATKQIKQFINYL